MRAATAQVSLSFVKLLHTVVWAVLAGCVIAIPVFAWLGYERQAIALILVVLVEVLVLIVNGGHCPLTVVRQRRPHRTHRQFPGRF